MQLFQLVGFSAHGGINLFFVETQFRSKIDYFIKMYLHHFIKKTAAIRVTLILEKTANSRENVSHLLRLFILTRMKCIVSTYTLMTPGSLV